jgi:hypothetical protein
VQDRSPYSPYPQADEAPTVRLPRVSAASSARRNRLGSVTFAVVLVGAVLAVLPSTAAFGLLVCFFAIVPAIIAFWRSRGGKATGGGRSLAAVVMAPVFFVVAVAVVGVTAPPPVKTAVPATASPVAVADAASPTVEQVRPAPESDVASPEPVAAAQASSAPPIVAQAAVPLAAPAAAPQRVVAAPAARPQPAPAAAPKPAPAPAPVAQPAPACDEGTHYINSSGNCVLRPVAGPSAPAGATAQCSDGTYSSSQHRQGTCSKHGGVAAWL